MVFDIKVLSHAVIFCFCFCLLFIKSFELDFLTYLHKICKTKTKMIPKNQSGNINQKNK